MNVIFICGIDVFGSIFVGKHNMPQRFNFIQNTKRFQMEFVQFYMCAYIVSIHFVIAKNTMKPKQASLFARNINITIFLVLYLQSFLPYRERGLGHFIVFRAYYYLVCLHS